MAYTQDVLLAYTEDEAGPYQTITYPDSHWYPAGRPAQYSHDPLPRSMRERL